VKTIAECLADELINAAKGSSNRWAARGAGVIQRGGQQCTTWARLEREQAERPAACASGRIGLTYALSVFALSSLPSYAIKKKDEIER
jgi:ribosomal protein S7